MNIKEINMNHKMTYKSIATSSFLILITFTNLAYAQSCNTTARNNTPDSRYQVVNNDEVKDRTTGLIWQRCLVGETWKNGQCSGTAKELTWHQALTEAKSQANSTKKSYRLPNIKELQGLTRYGCSPALNTKYFGASTESIDNLGFQVWSSTPSPIKTEGEFTYSLDQDSGIASQFSKSIEFYVRLVRSE